jgi:hypothetical protein
VACCAQVILDRERSNPAAIAEGKVRMEEVGGAVANVSKLVLLHEVELIPAFRSLLEISN